jgi:hypothetical protein
VFGGHGCRFGDTNTPTVKGDASDLVGMKLLDEIDVDSGLERQAGTNEF